MIAAGAVDEVRRLAALGLSSDLPAMRAVGVPPLLAHLRSELTLEAAVAQAKLDTRHYVKRQLTWARRNMMSWMEINSQFNFSIADAVFPIIDSWVDRLPRRA
jgi:tRNA dimethylallyltransferase